MPRIKEAQVAGLPVKTLRRLVGIPAHRPSAFATCVGARLRDQDHPPAPIGAGGRHNVEWQQQFIAAARQCSAQVPKVQRVRKTPVSGAAPPAQAPVAIRKPGMTVGGSTPAPRRGGRRRG